MFLLEQPSPARVVDIPSRVAGAPLPQGVIIAGGSGATTTGDDDTPLADAGVTTESTPIETPTRVDTGGDGAASPSSQQGVPVLAIAGIGFVGTLLRRAANIR